MQIRGPCSRSWGGPSLTPGPPTLLLGQGCTAADRGALEGPFGTSSTPTQEHAHGAAGTGGLPALARPGTLPCPFTGGRAWPREGGSRVRPHSQVPLTQSLRSSPTTPSTRHAPEL